MTALEYISSRQSEEEIKFDVRPGASEGNVEDVTTFLGRELTILFDRIPKSRLLPPELSVFRCPASDVTIVLFLILSLSRHVTFEGKFESRGGDRVERKWN